MADVVRDPAARGLTVLLAAVLCLSAASAFAQEPVKVALAIRESIETPEGRNRVAGRSLIAAHLGQVLLDRGLELRPLPERSSFEAPVLPRSPALANDARRAGADLLIAADFVIREHRRVSGKARPSELSISGEVRIVSTRAGKILGSGKVHVRQQGADLERALHAALIAPGDNLATQILALVTPHTGSRLDRAAEAGAVLQLRFAKVGTYAEQGRALLEITRGLEGVSELDRRDYYQEELWLEVRWRGTPQELGAALLSEAKKQRVVSTLALVSITADTLRLSL